jgi:hypothetical protein
MRVMTRRLLYMSPYTAEARERRRSLDDDASSPSLRQFHTNANTARHSVAAGTDG